jgi:hypothetical protein
MRKAESIFNSEETSADVESYIPEGRTLHNHRCENLKYYFRE